MGNRENKSDGIPHRTQIRRAVLERDQERCTNCLRSRKLVNTLDDDHNVPRGAGGSDVFSNHSTLCRQCHNAKEGDGLAPTVELQTTGQMDQYEFLLFKQFLKEMIPAMARCFDVRLIPKYSLDSRPVWHLPMGDIKRLDSRIAGEDVEYASLQVSDYM